MRYWFVVVAIGVTVMVTGCGGSSEDEQTAVSPDSAVAEVEAEVDGEGDDATEASETSGGDGTFMVGGDDGYTVEVAEFGEIANWWYDSSIVTATLCGEFGADRTLRIYRSSDLESRGGMFCEEGGGSILNFEAGRELEQPDQDGAIEILNGDIGVITAGGDTFGKSGVGMVTVEVGDATDPTAQPVILDVSITANTGQMTFAFSPSAGG